MGVYPLIPSIVDANICDLGWGGWRRVLSDSWNWFFCRGVFFFIYNSSDGEADGLSKVCGSFGDGVLIGGIFASLCSMQGREISDTEKCPNLG